MVAKYFSKMRIPCFAIIYPFAKDLYDWFSPRVQPLQDTLETNLIVSAVTYSFQGPEA